MPRTNTFPGADVQGKGCSHLSIQSNFIQISEGQKAPATSRSADSHISCRAAPTSSFPFPTLFYFLAISSTSFLGSLSLPAALKSSDLGLVGSRWVGQLNKGILSISISLEASTALALGCDNRGIPKTSTAGREG